MGHKRKEIRDRFVELLTEPPIMVSDVIALAPADASGPAEVDRAIECFGNRGTRIKSKDLPVMLVYTSKEENKIKLNTAPKIYYRELEVQVELDIDGELGEDGIDDFATEVEKRIIYLIDELPPEDDDPDLQFALLGLPYVDDIMLESTLTGHLADGQSEKFGAILCYKVSYLTEEPEEALAGDPFRGVDITVDGANAIKEETVTYP